MSGPARIFLAAWLGLTVTVGAGAQDFGRLFFSVEERLLMNQMREEGVVPQPTQGPRTTSVQPEAPAVGEVTFNGKVQRSDGETTIWVNGRPVLPGNSTPEGIRVKPTGRAGGETRFELPSGAGFELKVGQKIKVVSGKVLESYEQSPPEDAAAGFTGPLPGTAPAPPNAERESGPGALPGSLPPASSPLSPGASPGAPPTASAPGATMSPGAPVEAAGDAPAAPARP